MLAHQVHHVVHRLDTVERRAAAIGRAGRVRRDAAEPDLGADVGQRAGLAHGIAIAGVPRHHRVDLVEQARTEHVDLAGAALLGGGAEELDRPRPPAGQPVLHRNRRRRRGRAEQVMAAAVARCVLDQRLALRGGRLRQARQGIELADDADDRCAAAERGDERRGDVGHPGLHREPRGRELLLQEGAALRFLIAHFGQRPDPHGDVAVRVGARIDRRQHVAGAGRLPRGRRGGEGRDDQSHDERRASGHGTLHSITGGARHCNRVRVSTDHTAYESRRRSWRAMSVHQKSPSTRSTPAGRRPRASGCLCSRS